MQTKLMVDWLLLEWKLQIQTGYLMLFTQQKSYHFSVHNRNIISIGKRSLKNQISVRLERGSYASQLLSISGIDQRGPAAKNDNFFKTYFRKLAMTTNDS